MSKGVTLDKKQFINYTTKAHDTLHLVCTKFHSTPYRMRQLNPQINLDEIKEGFSLLVEVNSLGKVITLKADDNEDSSPFKIYHAQPDMTFMRKPLFQQCRSVEQRFVDKKNEQNGTDEFQKIKSSTSADYSDLNFKFEMEYMTTTGNIPGNLQITKSHIQFIPNLNDLKSVLVENTQRKDRDLTEDILERYQFKLMMEDVYLVRENTIDKNLTLEIYIFGVLGVDPPLKDEQDNYGVVKVVLLQKDKLDKPTELKIKTQLMKTEQLDNTHRNLELFVQLLNQLLSTDILQDNARLFQQVLKKSVMQEKLKEMNRKDLIHQQPSLNMKCESQVSFYSIVPIRQMDSLVINDKRLAQNLYKKKQLPVLKQTTEILDYTQFGQILKYVPEYLSQNEWYLMYSPTKHGTSYQELFRRCGMIGPHVMMIRDNHDTIFGAYLSENWTNKGDLYYGSTDSFVFTFKNKNIQVYPWTKKNDAFQMANKEGLHIGADERPAITIDNELMRGTSFPCETFGNDVLAGDYNFKIIEMEFWGLSDDCEIIQRALRQKSSVFGNDQ